MAYGAFRNADSSRDKRALLLFSVRPGLPGEEPVHDLPMSMCHLRSSTILWLPTDDGLSSNQEERKFSKIPTDLRRSRPLRAAPGREGKAAFVRFVEGIIDMYCLYVKT